MLRTSLQARSTVCVWTPVSGSTKLIELRFTVKCRKKPSALEQLYAFQESLKITVPDSIHSRISSSKVFESRDSTGTKNGLLEFPSTPPKTHCPYTLRRQLYFRSSNFGRLFYRVIIKYLPCE